MRKSLGPPDAVEAGCLLTRCARAGHRGRGPAASRSSGVVVLDLVYILAVIAVFAVVALVAKGVEKL
nr:hypothetical protein GCM10025699_64140 [Microbacterium flavescens]